MIPPPVSPDEAARIAALEKSGWAQVGADASINQWLGEVAGSLGLPMVTLSLVDRNQQMPVAFTGIDAKPCSREASFDGHVIMNRDPLVVPDATKDERFADNPFVSGPPYIRFYAGAPLITDCGKKVGALSAFDTRPHHFTAAFLFLLQEAAGEATLRLNAAASATTVAGTRMKRSPGDLQNSSLLGMIATGKMRDKLFFEEFLSQYFKESQRLLQILEHPIDLRSAIRACEDLRELARHMEFEELTSLCVAWELDLHSNTQRNRVSIQAMRQAWDSGVKAIRMVRADILKAHFIRNEGPVLHPA